ncbi:MAG TPA: DEAD/DEAH box helicase [Propionibacteriaceae bacterium]|nr:DEAD/DEAH box helicase [Propionibacteriaceae bacterium]
MNTLGWSDLRPLQRAAIRPILDGSDALLLAPTAGGKTEAAVFPLLTSMTTHRWNGLSILYICPLRALLNNLHPRIDGYAQWLGRRAGLWHGDTSPTQRKRLRVERPDLMLTTPESLEALLVSTLTDPHEFFRDLRAVVIDEVHAFAGDDRGWHLLAVLERLSRIAHRPLQRIGLSATVGNPNELLGWLQGTNAGRNNGTVVAPPAATSVNPPDVGLDYVGSVPNAAKVIGTLHRGEKRLVFCETRRRVEELALALRGLGVATFVSHSSLSIDERRRAEQAFSEARDCVIVSTSTLELGIDVGDLDRVIQLDAPNTVASFLQRLGRTGRRPDTDRNTLFLATSKDTLLQAAGLLELWTQGYVEPITAPPSPRHIAAQQILALCLQEGRVGDTTWSEWWGNLPIFDQHRKDIIQWLIATGHLDSDNGMLSIGAQAEKRYGRRNFMELLTVFTAAPQFKVLHGRQELGAVDPMMLILKVQGPRTLSLAGRPWLVTHIDWRRHHCYVEPTERYARSLWTGTTLPQSFALCQAQRNVLLGTDPAVELSQRAKLGLGQIRESHANRAALDATIVIDADTSRWWTWAGGRGNTSLAAALPDYTERDDSYPDLALRLRSDVTRMDLIAALEDVDPAKLPPVEVTEEALAELKFSEVLPPDLAIDTLASRCTDIAAAASVLFTSVRWVKSQARDCSATGTYDHRDAVGMTMIRWSGLQCRAMFRRSCSDAT